MIEKNRDREHASFANINLLGKCNAKCFFCLGEDIPELLSIHNHLSTHFSEWENFDYFLGVLQEHQIAKVYITGQNTDSLLYKYLEELIDYLQDDWGFDVGLRTNGYLFETNPDLIRIANKCIDEIGVSVQSLNPKKNKLILGRSRVPDWDIILPQINNLRVSIVVNRYNVSDFFEIVKYLSKFDNVKYIQARRISTDTRFEDFEDDIQLYESLANYVAQERIKVKDFYSAEIYNIYGKEVCFWRTVETSVGSMNFFTDGTYSTDYFVVEGYLDNYEGGKNEIFCERAEVPISISL